MKKMVQLSSLLFAIVSAQHVAALSLSSKDIQSGKMMGPQQEFNGFGCTGENLSPHLRWQNAPKGTKSFAITAYDPDAPTGSGWWHWQVINIPVNDVSLRLSVISLRSTGFLALSFVVLTFASVN